MPDAPRGCTCRSGLKSSWSNSMSRGLCCRRMPSRSGCCRCRKGCPSTARGRAFTPIVCGPRSNGCSTRPRPRQAFRWPTPRRLLKIPTAAGQTIVSVDIDDVPCLSSDRHHTRVLTAGDERCCYLAIGELASRLDPERFVRVHRSPIVNLRAVSRLLRENRRSALRIKGLADPVPVSRSSQAAWMARLGLTAGTGPGAGRCLHGRRAKGLRVYGSTGLRVYGFKGLRV